MMDKSKSKEKKVSGITWVLRFVVAVAFDAVQGIVGLASLSISVIPIVNALSFLGEIASFSITVFGALTFLLWFTLEEGFAFFNKKNIASGAITAIIEATPLSFLPAFTLFVLTRYLQSKAKTLPGIAAVSEKMKP